VKEEIKFLTRDGIEVTILESQIEFYYPYLGLKKPHIIKFSKVANVRFQKRKVNVFLSFFKVIFGILFESTSLSLAGKSREIILDFMNRGSRDISVDNLTADKAHEIYKEIEKRLQHSTR